MLLCALAACNAFWLLGDMPIKNWDEARHGVSAYEMLAGGDYWVNTYQGQPDYWNLKPVLSFWPQLAGFNVAGFTPLGLRLFSALFGLATIALTVWVAGASFSPWAGLLAGFILITTKPYIVSHGIRSGDSDATFVLFTTVALAAVILARKSPGRLCVAALATALAFLTKSWHVLPVAMSLLIAMGVNVRNLRLRGMDLVAIVACGALPVVLWLAMRYPYDGVTFLRRMIETDLIHRATQPLEGHVMPWYEYIRLIFQSAVPLLCVMLVAQGAVWWRQRGSDLANVENPTAEMDVSTATAPRQYARTVVVLWFVCPVLLFTLSSTKIPWYIYQTYPPLAILLADGLAGLLARRPGLAVTRMCILALVIILVAREFTILKDIHEKLTDPSPEAMLQHQLREAGNNPANTAARVYLSSGSWSQSGYLAAQMYGRFLPMDSGAAGFRDDHMAGVKLLFTLNEGRPQ